MADQQAMQNFLELQNKSYDIKFELDDTNYRPIENIGTGAYGVVCSADHISTAEKVAIKKIPDIFEQPTIAKRTYREIKILKHFKHDNIIAIREILKPSGAIENLRDVYIVLDLMETDLHRIIHSKQELSDEHVRYFLYQLLRGLKYIHSANVIHRDLKPSNLLVNENCDLKIGDFGMARAVSSKDNQYNALMTQYVATRWYRAPELMMARLAYTGAVDIWSVGCIFAEMLGRKQIFPGRDFIHQLKLIIGVLGTPSKEFLKLTQSDTIKKFIKGWGDKKPVPLRQLYPKAHQQAVHLLNQLLCINPQKRLSVEGALSQPFLSKYHDPGDEPICVPAFDFDFEEKAKTTSEVKEAIIQEIMEYHIVPEKPKLVFDFRPVPKAEIQSKPTKSASSSPSPLSFPSTSSDSSRPGEKDANFGLDAFLKQIRTEPDSSAAKAKTGLQAFFKAQNSSKGTGLSNQMPSFLSTNSPPGSEGNTSPTEDRKDFKVPQGLPLAKMRNLRVKSKEDKNQDDIEMLSAKSATSDVVMLSANKDSASIEPPDDKHASALGATAKSETSGEKTMNTKEMLKAAILSAALRKQKGEIGSKPKPTTALQRQREREEKKRKKIEKAQERKKKQKEKSPGKINLSDEDKNLLERWACMQQPSGGQNIQQSAGVGNMQSNQPLGNPSAIPQSAVVDNIQSVQPMGNQSTIQQNARVGNIQSIQPLGNQSTIQQSAVVGNIQSIQPLGNQSTIQQSVVVGNRQSNQPMGNQSTIQQSAVVGKGHSNQPVQNQSNIKQSTGFTNLQVSQPPLIQSSFSITGSVQSNTQQITGLANMQASQPSVSHSNFSTGSADNNTGTLSINRNQMEHIQHSNSLALNHENTSSNLNIDPSQANIQPSNTISPLDQIHVTKHIDHAQSQDRTFGNNTSGFGGQGISGGQLNLSIHGNVINTGAYSNPILNSNQLNNIAPYGNQFNTDIQVNNDSIQGNQINNSFYGQINNNNMSNQSGHMRQISSVFYEQQQSPPDANRSSSVNSPLESVHTPQYPPQQMPFHTLANHPSSQMSMNYENIDSVAAQQLLPEMGLHRLEGCSLPAELLSLPTIQTVSSQTSSSSTFSPLTNPLESLLDVLTSGRDPSQNSADLESSKLPPSYSEAMQTKLHNMGSPEHPGLPFLNSPENITSNHQEDHHSDTSGGFLPFQTYHEPDNEGVTHAACMYMTSPDNEEAGPSQSNNKKEGNLLSVITHKMMKSHVDDLTLTKTPKGTGGGYGVGLDMEVVMTEASRQFTPNQGSAPLSATESLIGDWLEVSGMKGLDPKDYEALERELGLGSPINLNDIVTTPS